jgi:glycosyltransferase involved in cell wall biosynthesis
VSTAAARAVIVSLSTYAAPHNDGKLAALARRIESVVAVAGDVATLWGGRNSSRRTDGYDVIVLPVRFGASNATTRLQGLDAVIRAARPSVVHVECEPWQAVASQAVGAARGLGVPVGIQFAEAGPRLSGPGGWLRRRRGEAVLRRCDYAVGWSAASTAIARGLAPDIVTATFPATGVRLDATPRGPQARWFGAGCEGLAKVAFVGRFSEEKGIADFLRICDELSARRELRVALAGGGGEEREVAAWVKDRPWAVHHGIVGRAEVIDLLAVTDALVCPSRTTRTEREQFGKAAVEAMAVGTPVFAYDSGALAEVIGEGGVVVPEGSVVEMVEALDAHLSGGRSSSARAEQARRRAGAFTDDALAEQLLELWAGLSAPVTSLSTRRAVHGPVR